MQSPTFFIRRPHIPWEKPNVTESLISIGHGVNSTKVVLFCRVRKTLEQLRLCLRQVAECEPTVSLHTGDEGPRVTDPFRGIPPLIKRRFIKRRFIKRRSDKLAKGSQSSTVSHACNTLRIVKIVPRHASAIFSSCRYAAELSNKARPKSTSLPGLNLQSH